MSELLACPFCGGEARIFALQIGKGWRVVCSKPFCAQGPNGDTEAEAIAAWNSRADYHGYEQAAIEAWESIKAWNSRAERTCHIEGSYYDELFDETCTNLSCGHAIWQNESPNYCSECGAKVLRNTPKYSETGAKVVGE